MNQPVLAPSPLRPKRSLPNDLITDSICSWLIAVGVLLALRQLFRFDNPIIILMFRAAFILALTILLTRRHWWVLPSVVAAFGLCIFLFALITDKLSSLISYFSGFFDWWINQFPINSRYEQAGASLLVNWIIAALVCLIVYLFVRRVRSFMAIASVSAVLILIIAINDFHDSLGAIAFIAAGAFPLLIRNNLQDLSGKLDEIFVKLRSAMVPGIIICVVFALLAHLIVPENASAWKNSKLSDLINRIQGVQTKFGDEPFTLQSSGLQPDAERLGGDLMQTHEAVLNVNTNMPSLMKGMVYDTYTGQGWTESGGTASSKTTSQDSVNMGTVFRGYGSADALLGDAIKPASATVTLIPGGFTAFTSGYVSSAASISDQSTLYFNTRSELFSTVRLSKKFQYHYQSELLNRNSDSLESRIGALENAAAYPDDIKTLYLNLPDSLPTAVADKAKSITQNISSPYEKMEALETYLKTNYQYTLKPGAVPDGEDFVNYFLKSGKGYCVYYASAMAVMARTLGIPSRFVIGFGLRPSGDNNYTAYTDTAHAWVECYIRGVGWVTFDPTAGSNYSSLFQSNTIQTAPIPSLPTQTSATNSTAATTSTLTTTPTDTLPSSSTTAEQPALHVSILWFGLFAAAAVLLLLAYAALRMLRQSKAYQLERMRKRYPQNGACADHYYTDILKQLTLLGFSPAPSETIFQHGKRVSDAFQTYSAEEIRVDGPLVEKAFEIVINWRYGEMNPSDNELEDIAEVHEALEKRLRDKMNRVQYARIRLLFAK